MSKRNPSVLWSVEQDLNTDEKAQARSNIGVADAISGAINALDAEEVSTDGTNVQFQVTETDGKITGVSVTTDNTVNETDVSNAITTAINGLDSNATSNDGTNVQVKVTETDGKISAVNITSDNTVNSTDVSNAITTAINGLDADATSTDGTNVQVKVTETDGKITAVNITSDNTVNSTDVGNAITTAIGNLDVPSTGTGAITGFGANKTLETLSETDGKIEATFQNIALGNINHEGKIGTTANKVIVTGENGVLTTGATDGTYDSSTNPIATQSTVTGAINGLTYSDSAVTNQFVTSVSEADGIISVTRAQPSIGDLAAVASDKKNYSIGTNSSDGKIEAQNLTVSTATDGGDSDDLTFVSSVTQASNGKIAVTTKKVPYSIQFIDTNYTYDEVTALIAAGKYPVVRYQNGYDTLYLPMFTAPSNSGTDIEFRGFAKNTASSVYKIVCDYETGFGELTSTAFVSTEDASNFIDNVTFDASVGDNLPGSVTLKYHKYNADYTGIITLSGDQGSGMGIRTVTPTQSPYAYRIVNLRPVPAYPTTYKDRILSVNSNGDGLEWRTPTNADWNANSGPSQILNKPTIPSIQYKNYGGAATTASTLLIDADDPDGYVDVSVDSTSKGRLVAGPYRTLLNSGINGVGDANTPVYITSDGTFDTCLTSSDVEFISFNYSDPTPQDAVYTAIVAARTNNRLPVLYCGTGGSTAYWVYSGEGATGYSFSRQTGAGCSLATIGPDHAFTITTRTIGTGDVVGPSSANNNHIPLYDGTTGKLIKNSKFYFTDEAQADTAEAAKQVKTKAYNDPFRTSQQIVRESQGSGHQDGDFAYWYALNKYRSVAFGISSYGNIKMTEFVQSGSDSVSPSSEQDIITSNGTGNNTVYLFKGTADKASKIDTSYAIGSGTKPVYVAADGTVTACDFQVVIGALPTTTDTIAFL